MATDSAPPGGNLRRPNVQDAGPAIDRNGDLDDITVNFADREETYARGHAGQRAGEARRVAGCAIAPAVPRCFLSVRRQICCGGRYIGPGALRVGDERSNR
jgi:hypothetical protein